MKKHSWSQRLNHWRQKPPLVLVYSLFLVLSIGSLYGVFRQNQVFSGDDIGFHSSRIEGLAQSLQQGEWFPKINYFITGGMGYATGIFYPDFWLYPAAIFRLVGLTVSQSYLCFVVLVTFGTFVVAYHSFYWVYHNAPQSLMFAFLYGLAAYRQSDVIYRAAVGEFLALMVLPIVFVGLYEVVLRRENRWPILAVGMAGLFYAHLLSAGILVLFSGVFVLLNSRGMWQEKRRLVALIKAAGVTILLVASALFPMMEQLAFQRLRVQDEPIFYLQRMAEAPLDYLVTASRNVGTNNLGLPILVFLVVSVLLVRQLERVTRQLLVMAGLFFFLATSYFPHWLFQETFLVSLQFPWRYFILVTFCVSWVTARQYQRFFPERPTWQRGVVLLMVVGVVGINGYGQYQLRGIEERRSTQEALNQLDGSQELGFGMEFLPSGMSGWANSTTLLSEPSDQIRLTNMSRKKNVFSVTVDAADEVRLIFPLIYYKGYQVRMDGEGTSSAIQDAGVYGQTDMHGFVQVTVSGQGKLTVWYEETWLQRVSFWVSLGTSLGLCGGWLLHRRRQQEVKKSQETKETKEREASPSST